MDIKVLFAFYPLYVSYNYGISLLSSLCHISEIKTEVCLLDNLGEFKEYIERNQFNYICFSCVTEHDYELSLPFMRLAKDTGISTILGGVYPRLGTYINPPVDLICRGEGEMLPLFLTKGYKGLFETPKYCDDLNILPLADYDLFKHIPYDRELPIGRGDKILPYSSSRGCPFSCNFCAVSYQYPKVRIRTKVADDLEYLCTTYNPDVIHFLDELIPYYSDDWCGSWGDFNIPFAGYIRADITEKQLIFLKEHGMIGCFFGVESGNERFRNNALGKKLTDKQVRTTANLLKDMGMDYMVSYMNGYPGETWEMQAETMKMSREIGGYPVFYQYENLVRS